jgi:hypothetical protein
MQDRWWRVISCVLLFVLLLMPMVWYYKVTVSSRRVDSLDREVQDVPNVIQRRVNDALKSGTADIKQTRDQFEREASVQARDILLEAVNTQRTDLEASSKAADAAMKEATDALVALDEVVKRAKAAILKRQNQQAPAIR